MSKSVMVIVVTFLLLPAALFAGAGGGIEYIGNLGPDMLSSPGGGFLAPIPSGSLVGFSGFGYAISPRGWKIGGFGTFLYAQDLSLRAGPLDVTDIMCGFGGVISGGQAQIGPMRFSVNLRLGAGVVGIRFVPNYPTNQTMMPVPALYGSFDGEVGVVFVPAMLLSAYVGLGSTLTIDPTGGPVPMPAFIAGVRVAWGSF